jgi:hypothetical protein
MKLITFGNMPPYLKMDPSIFMLVWYRENAKLCITIAFMWPFYAKEKTRSLLSYNMIRYRQAWGIQIRLNTVKAQFEENTD